MNLTDELQKLADLHHAGHLSDAEFAEAKRRLLSGTGGVTSAPRPAPVVVSAVPTLPSVAGPEKPKRYRSSRWSSGNLFFPDTLTLSRDGMLFRKGALFSSSEEHINYRAVASFRIKNGIFLSNISIETSGGTQPIYMNGLWKSDAKAIQEILRSFQRE